MHRGAKSDTMAIGNSSSSNVSGSNINSHSSGSNKLSREVLDLLSGPGAGAAAAAAAAAGSGGVGAGGSSKLIARTSGVAGVDSLPSIVPSANMATSAANTTATTTATKARRKWIWAPFTSSARTDNAVLYHWVRAGIEYPDYPYATFNVHIDPVTYTDEQYELYFAHLPTTTTTTTNDSSSFWTRSETDTLMDQCRIYELRWPIIHDRHLLHSGGGYRTVEELQYRYYYIANVLTQLQVNTAMKEEIDLITTDLLNHQQQKGQVVEEEKVTATTQPAGVSVIESSKDGSQTDTSLPSTDHPSQCSASMSMSPESTTASTTTTINNPSSQSNAAEIKAHVTLLIRDVVNKHLIRNLGTGTTSSSSNLFTISNASTSTNTNNSNNSSSSNNNNQLTLLQLQKRPFNLQKEQERRKQLEISWNRTKEEEGQVAALQREIKLIDVQLRKLKRTTKNTQASNTTMSTISTSAKNNSSSKWNSSTGSGGDGKAGGNSSSSSNSKKKKQHHHHHDKNPNNIGDHMSESTTTNSRNGKLNIVTSSMNEIRSSKTQQRQRQQQQLSFNNITTDATFSSLHDGTSSNNISSSSNNNSTLFTSTTPIPTPGIPYLQSMRLLQPAEESTVNLIDCSSVGVAGAGAGAVTAGGIISKSLLKKMNSILVELNIPPKQHDQSLPQSHPHQNHDLIKDPLHDHEQPQHEQENEQSASGAAVLLPTKRVCDLYDVVRKLILILISLQKMVNKKENDIRNKRLRFKSLNNKISSSTTNITTTSSSSSSAPSKPVVAETKESGLLQQQQQQGRAFSASGGKTKSASSSKSKSKSKSGETSSVRSKSPTNGIPSSTIDGRSSATVDGKVITPSTTLGTSVTPTASSVAAATSRPSSSSKKSSGSKRKSSSSPKREKPITPSSSLITGAGSTPAGSASISILESGSKKSSSGGSGKKLSKGQQSQQLKSAPVAAPLTPFINSTTTPSQLLMNTIGTSTNTTSAASTAEGSSAVPRLAMTGTIVPAAMTAPSPGGSTAIATATSPGHSTPTAAPPFLSNKQGTPTATGLTAPPKPSPEPSGGSGSKSSNKKRARKS